MKKEIVSLDHIALNVNSIKESVEWYNNNFEIKIIYEDDSWALFSIGETKIALTLKKEHPPHIGFLVDSFPNDLKSNIKTHRDNTEYVYISDNSGNILELIKRK